MMKKMVLCISLVLAAASVAMSEEKSRIAIIKKDTGKPATIEEMVNPDFEPEQAFDILVQINNLTAKWNEGYVTYTYTYYSDKNQKISTSQPQSIKERTQKDSWNMAKVIRVTLPGNIPKGAYRLGFDVTDYHTGKMYKGSVQFTISMGKTPAPQSPSSQPPAQQTPKGAPATDGFDFEIADAVLTLKSITKNSNKITFSFIGVNNDSENLDLRIYPYTTRINSETGTEYKFSDVGGDGNLVTGVSLPPEVPMSLEISFKKPAVNVNKVALLEVFFYYIDDNLVMKNVVVPWP